MPLVEMVVECVGIILLPRMKGGGGWCRRSIEKGALS